ncbi:hypothetical protein V6N13_074317 [Hibiscus sabdariffa]
MWYDFFLRILEQKRCPMLAHSPRSAWTYAKIDQPRQMKEAAGFNIKKYPCDNGYKEVTALPPRDIVYDQDIQLTGLRDKPITQQDALPKSESPPRFLLRQDPLSPFEASPLSSCLGRTYQGAEPKGESGVDCLLFEVTGVAAGVGAGLVAGVVSGVAAGLG